MIRKLRERICRLFYSNIYSLFAGLRAADVTLLNIDNDQASAGQLLVYLALIRR